MRLPGRAQEDESRISSSFVVCLGGGIVRDAQSTAVAGASEAWATTPQIAFPSSARQISACEGFR